MGFDKTQHTTDGMKALCRSFNDASGREKGHPGRVAIMREDSPHVLYQKLVLALEETLKARPEYYEEWEKRDELAPLLDFAVAETAILAETPDSASEEEEEFDDDPAPADDADDGEDGDSEDGEEDDGDAEDEEEDEAPPPRAAKTKKASVKKAPVSAADTDEDEDEDGDDDGEERDAEEQPALAAAAPAGRVRESDIMEIVQAAFDEALSEIAKLLRVPTAAQNGNPPRPVITQPVKVEPLSGKEITIRLQKGDLMERDARIAFLRSVKMPFKTGASNAALALKCRSIMDGSWKGNR